MAKSVTRMPEGEESIRHTRKEKDGSDTVLSEKHRSGPIPSGKRKIAGPHAEVGLTLGMKINIGNFESIEMRVTRMSPCAPGDEDATYDETFQWVEGHVKKLREEVREGQRRKAEARKRASR